MTRGDMRTYTLSDDFGRNTVFTGAKLVGESTDTAAGAISIPDLTRRFERSEQGISTVLRDLGIKPQWLDVEVYSTEAGNFVVCRTTHYRIRHQRELCYRAEGYDLVDATELDTYPCPACNKDAVLERGFAQTSRISVEVYHNPEELINSFQVDGRYSHLARSILADLAEQDDRIDSKWSTVMVP